MTEEKRGLDLLDFPCMFIFRAVAGGQEQTRIDCESAVADTLSRPVQGVEVKPSSKGNYQVIRLGVTVLSTDEVRAVYAALHAVEGVRLIL